MAPQKKGTPSWEKEAEVTATFNSAIISGFIIATAISKEYLWKLNFHILYFYFSGAYIQQF